MKACPMRPDFFGFQHEIVSPILYNYYTTQFHTKDTEIMSHVQIAWVSGTNIIRNHPEYNSGQFQRHDREALVPDADYTS